MLPTLFLLFMTPREHKLKDEEEEDVISPQPVIRYQAITGWKKKCGRVGKKSADEKRPQFFFQPVIGLQLTRGPGNPLLEKKCVFLASLL